MKLQEITRDIWLHQIFPEWGTWLNEEIEATVVPQNNVSMWWLGCTGIWLKTDKATNVLVDLWCGTGKQTMKLPSMSESHQMARMSGGRIAQPNKRIQPCVIDPFEIRNIDAFIVTHYHHDHLDKNVAAAILQNCSANVPFIGPQKVVDQWIEWGVPEKRCKIIKPGDNFTIKDVDIEVLDSFDRTVLVTDSYKGEHANTIEKLGTMDQRSVNYLFKTSGGNIYHAGDSHYSAYFANHGKFHSIDVAFGSYGENPIGIVDKMTSIDILRMAEALKTKVVIPLHYDIWSNMKADPNEIVALWQMRKNRLHYRFKPYIWDVGGCFTYPGNKDDIYYHYPRGFNDAYEWPIDLPYKSFL